MSHAHRARGPSAPWRVLAAVLALAAAVCLVMWADRATPTIGTESAAGIRPTETATTGGAMQPVVARQPRPVALAIPVVDVRTRLTRLGLASDGTVEVPTNPALAGWYDLGPPPGAPGTSVVLGHVDSADGPAVFARLVQLTPGDRVRVALDDGTSVTYAVRSITTYANADFPAQRVYGGQGRRELNLVTCGGEYDASRGGYQSNVVVNARWVSGTRS